MKSKNNVQYTVDVFHVFLSILISQKDSSNKSSCFIKFHLVCSTLVVEKLFSCNNFRAVVEEARLLLMSCWSMVSFEIDCWRSLKKAAEGLLIREPVIETWSIFGLRSLRVRITGFLLTMFKITRCDHSAPKLCKDFFPPASPRSRTFAAGFCASVGRRMH